ncbi:MAG: LacI family transcriptional regulator [Chitinophagaceae bacterium BSSC1]|nr:MAG: LacI family transcriptional regulator [Chitinophagaceae bacterium BSSC1]
MPRVSCPKCNKVETIQKSGIVRNKQRFYCKDCNYNFTIHHESNKQKSKTKISNSLQTSLQDIAKAIGISVSTVSRALHNHPDISTKTKTAVQKLANELSYQPNALAQSLVTKSTHTLGVIIPNLETTFFSSMLSGIQHVAAKAGYRVVICQSDESHRTEVANVQALMNNMIDGLLLCHTLKTDTYDHIKIQMKRGIPIVQFYRVNTEVETSRVYCEDKMGAELITQHLIDKGCKRIALLLGPKEINISQKRKNGYLNILKKNGMIEDPELIAHVDFSQPSVIKVVDNWLKLQKPIDAIFSISDKSAVQIIQYLKKNKIKVPDTIAVAGFGNEYTGEIIEPQLTTYDVRTVAIGEEAAKILLDKIINQNASLKEITVKGKLIIRESSMKKSRAIK